MRLTHKEIDTIKNSVLSLDADARIYLFGSRIDDAKRGGDIDLLIESSILTKQDLRKIRWQFFGVFGEQKMDLVLDTGIENQTFINMIKPTAVQL
ncbi:nucleotidyltransferase domain-containing protein [methanotrophic endosymbiont of Bathymodiolus puteoserpentis (Logatchev)]|jgi:predicted nucleotidyltransferase|uniref:nucleotidyltransferase domain-containing protein n=1 Tax=methanotrophic endosymbiont of Bathymodiolus puteoserpentis (Logatchev) TaxID=343235 RepID=UPI0013C72489|nr:nucleotidyltransferase domain-containing protein [methanotrophic endosymbiont of Bathymodiolus puteoserpentis (Logatchev)]SHE20524.1 DNA polymerase, beta-like region [methanotrophic endosymbiont of Bathymodiolus puteoserpentis (Logatchev)]